MLRKDIVEPVPDSFADDDCYNGREVEEADLLRSEAVDRLEEDG